MNITIIILLVISMFIFHLWIKPGKITKSDEGSELCQEILVKLWNAKMDQLLKPHPDTKRNVEALEYAFDTFCEVSPIA